MISKVLKLNISKYFAVSCLASIMDISISNLLYFGLSFNYILACNAGIISGFIFQYYISAKYIFKAKNFISSFIVYLWTFILGTIIANASMLVSFNILNIPFIYSKLISMGLPFFIMYFIRKSMLLEK